MISKSTIGLMAAGAIVGAVAFGIAAASPRDDHLASGAGANGEVSKAEFDRLEGQLQDLQRRVSALERNADGAGKPHMHPAADNWENH
jgi:hypothetical protein